jgi:protein-S-isoprenylcysteine O-methyltransferase Ste14
VTLRTFAWIELLACWAVWWYPFLFRAPHAQKRASITVAGPTRVGLFLETIAILLAWIPARGTPRTGVAFLIAVFLLSAIACIAGWTAVIHLGKQFRLHAGLYVDHELVRTGPYRVVRHPIYASLLAMFLASALLLSSWPRALMLLVVFVVGTEIRVRSEDHLLASRFGKEFFEYQKRVAAYVPFVR